MCTGTSKVALDVLAGVTSEYLLNVGRTLRFLCDKYSNSMTAEVNDVFMPVLRILRRNAPLVLVEIYVGPSRQEQFGLSGESQQDQW